LMPCWARKLRTTWERLAPNAILYSRVPRSSAWPSTVMVYCEYCCSQRAWLVSVCVASGERSTLSVEKYTISPTLTAKSRAEPGVAGLVRPPCPNSLSGFGVLEQPVAASAIRIATENEAPALRHLDSSILVPSHGASRKPPPSIQLRPVF